MGALLASLLAAAGARVVVFERDAAPRTLPRAAHLDDDAMRILQAAGAADVVAAGARVIEGMDVVDARGRRLVRARKRPGDTGWPTANLVHQPDVEAALRAGLERYRELEVRREHDVRGVEDTDGGPILRVAGPGGEYEERFGWVVGCDGARSQVRTAMVARLSHVGRSTRQRWLVIDGTLRGPASLAERLRHVADPLRPSTYVPFAGRRRRWEFRLEAGEDDSAATRPETIAALLRPHVDPQLVDVERVAVYTFEGAVATHWRRGHVMLAGDAAHVMPPFIGQGLCSGLRDAAFLGWALAAVARGASPPALLDAYERERRPHAAAAVRLSMRAGRWIGMGSAGAALRDGALRFARRSPSLARLLDGVTVGPPRIAAAVAGTGGRTLRAVPQPWVETAAGERLRLDDALGPGWAVIGLGLDPRAWAGEHAAWGAAGARFLRVLSPGEAHHSAGPALRDPAGELAGWAGRAGRGPLAVVVRPDRFVFGTYGAGAGQRAGDELGRWFVGG